jgi:hypothetical protein
MPVAPPSAGGLTGYDQVNNLPSPAVSMGSSTPPVGGLGPPAQGLLACSLVRQAFAAAGVNPGATAADNVIATFALAPNALDGITIGGNQTFRGVRIAASGIFAGTSHVNTVKMIFNATTAVLGATVSGGTTLVTTGAITNGGAAQMWWLEALVFKIGLPGSNTQYAQQLWSFYTIAGVSTVLNTPQPVFPTAVENLPINIAITGNAATTATDIALNYFEVFGLN